jgi:hypothetical protein
MCGKRKRPFQVFITRSWHRKCYSFSICCFFSCPCVLCCVCLPCLGVLGGCHLIPLCLCFPPPPPVTSN